jgi:hypothetical protein
VVLTRREGTGFDKMFAEVMIDHHNGAITMAKDEQKNGKNADAVKMAGDIVKAHRRGRAAPEHPRPALSPVDGRPSGARRTVGRPGSCRAHVGGARTAGPIPRPHRSRPRCAPTPAFPPTGHEPAPCRRGTTAAALSLPLTACSGSDDETNKSASDSRVTVSHIHGLGQGHPGEQLHGMVDDLPADGVRTGAVRGDIAPGELASYCMHALTAAGVHALTAAGGLPSRPRSTGSSRSPWPRRLLVDDAAHSA